MVHHQQIISLSHADRCSGRGRQLGQLTGSKQGRPLSTTPSQVPHNKNPVDTKPRLVCRTFFVRRSTMAEQQVVVTIKCSNADKAEITCSAAITVAEFKILVADKLNVPAEQQRLIYKGRILKDESTLEQYGEPFSPFCLDDLLQMFKLDTRSIWSRAEERNPQRQHLQVRPICMSSHLNISL
jgi:hypothetical protein